MRIRPLLVACFSLCCLAEEARRIPTIDDLQGLRSAAAPQISPDGAWVAFQVQETDLKQDAYVTHVWVAQTATGRCLQLTRGEKSCVGPKWSPTGTWLAFTSSRSGDKSQLYLIRPDGGEALPISKAENGVGAFAWSPDGRRIAFLTSDVREAEVKARKDHLGEFEVVRREYAHQHLRILDVEPDPAARPEGTELTQGKSFSVGSFSWSPDGTRIAFSAAINPDLVNGSSADIYVVDLATRTPRRIVDQPGPDTHPHWSPDGTRIVFASAMGSRQHFHANTRLAVVPAEGGAVRSLTDGFDENPALVAWNQDGVYFQALQKTASHLFRLDPDSRKIERISQQDQAITSGFSFTKDGKRLAFAGTYPEQLAEIYLSAPAPFIPRRLTSFSPQLKPFRLGKREVITWKSRDGTPIEGILVKPADFDPARKYPLLCILHGGPTGVDRPTAVDTSYYPADLWVGRGALVLKVNYRGSAGYGEKFRQLNVRNLGVGDAWDVLSGIDHLVSLGLADPAKVGCMGWSQGGYISAFLTTHSDRFAAVSVGAGIADWSTYYYNTDITPFTVQYLGATPAEDPAIYALTSPMTAIAKAKTPTLIQHGENDKRVPIANAYQLRQGLQDQGVRTELVVYKGFGHGISKPRAMRAVMLHNLLWFNHHLFGDPLPDLAAPDLPKKDPGKKAE